LDRVNVLMRTENGSPVALSAVCRASFALLLALWLCVMASGHALAAVATDITLATKADGTEVTVHLSEPVKFRVITLPDPYRVVIDLSDVDFEVPDTADRAAGGVVNAFRYGKFAEGKARIVIDTAGPARVIKAIPSETGEGAVLRVRLAPTTEHAFGKVYRKRKRREVINRQDAAAWEAVAEPVTPAEDGKHVIVIDPGHGGVDSGAIVPGRTREKDIVLSFSKTLRRALMQSGKYRVHMTRSTDVFVPLARRVEIARRHGAHLFISVHADSVGDKKFTKVSGTTIYTLSEGGSDSAAQEFAERENKSDMLAGVELPETSDELANILIDLAQRETNARSVRFARTALRHIRTATRLSRGPHRSAGFVVLKAPDIPSVLIELGYLSNPDDEKRLKSPKWRASVARSIARSVGRYFALQGSALPF